MACFLVPAAEAIVVTTAAVLLKKHEQSKTQAHLSAGGADTKQPAATGFAKKLFWLADLLWGGVILLAFEHIWHGEVVPWFPFLTAMSDPADAAEMFHEMATVGVCMAALITVVWVVMCKFADAIVRRPETERA